jgi:hypothetical protein
MGADVDSRELDKSCAGSDFGLASLEGLPAEVDPGNTEFHTFGYDAGAVLPLRMRTGSKLATR